ncbi:MAG: retropepsin-like aspartic protease [Acidobacteriaceae bacterium]
MGGEVTPPVRFGFASATPLILVLSIHAQDMSAHIAMEEMSGVPIVEVSVNGAGPYPFVLDTGANVTVISRQLLRKLNLPWAGSVTIAASLGDSPQQRTEAATLGIAGQTVEHIEVNTLDESQFGALEGHVQGILGENFLKYFDLLIDNDHHSFTLDRTTNLANSFEGERLPLARTGKDHFGATRDRIVVPLQLALLARTVSFLLDSGANTAMLFPAKGEAGQLPRNAGRGSIHSLNMSQNCHAEQTRLAIGKQTFQGVVLAACENRTRDETDTDGLLPTDIFHRLFISHHHDYLIANPHPVKRAVSPKGVNNDAANRLADRSFY